jgi:hypothetical protein
MESIQNFVKKIFGTENIANIEFFNIKYIKNYKIVVFVPPSHSEKIANAMAVAGAGVIGKYRECSFRLEGIGTFKGGKGTKPYLGKKGKLEAVDEIRLEMICSPKVLNKVITEMLKVHPYDEPAYDIYKVLSGKKDKNVYAAKLELKNPVSISGVLKKINSKMDSSLIPDNWKKMKIKNAIIDFSEDNSLAKIFGSKKNKTLCIAKNFKRLINIRLI